MKKSQEEMPQELTERFSRALLLATDLHVKQRRKGKSTPYVSHLLGVTSLVLDAGGDEDQAVAALLHDAIEDQGDKISLGQIREEFGARVAEIVEKCSDRFEGVDETEFNAEEKLEYWRARKTATIEKLNSEDGDTAHMLVACADKLHNAREILHDLRSEGSRFWARFTNPNAEEQVAYYRNLAGVFAEKLPAGNRLVTEFQHVIRQIEDTLE